MTKPELRTLIGKNIRAMRRARGLSTDDLAGLLGISTSYLAMLEQGRRGTTQFTLYKLVRAMDITIDSLFFGEPPTLPDPGGLKIKREKISCQLTGLNEHGLDFISETISNLYSLTKRG